jgi:alpha-tubulin suppressor-like RCC1 family protein
VSCIGGGSSGRLGTGNFNNTDVPVTMLRPDGMAPLTGVLEVEANGGTACMRTAAHVYCVGNNQFGQLGQPAPHSSCLAPPTTHYDCTDLPIEVTGFDATRVIDLQLDGDYSCALLDTGHMYCWGFGGSGAIGNGGIASTPVPTEPNGVTGVAEMRLANGATCALKHDGTVWCWGEADFGQVGDGHMSHDSATCTALTDMTTCAANAICTWNGTACHQQPCVNEDGSLFDCQLTPVQVVGITDGVHLAAGSQHVCVLRASGQISCWGASLRYQLGNEMRPDPFFSPVTVVALGP